nr:hypothetical protein [Tanacetum cinerariifolium]
DITLVNDQDDEQMFDVNDLQGKEVFVQEDVASEITAASIATTDSATATMTVDEVTLAQALMEIKKEPVKLKKKDQIMLDEEVALKLQVELQTEFNKEQRLEREKSQQEEEEANIALIETGDDVQAKIDADYQLAKRLKAKEQQELNDEEKATLFMQILEKRRKVNTFVDYKTELVEGSSKRAGEELEQENAKKYKMEDDKESVELKQCLEIIIEDGDDVTFDTTPLSFMSLTIVDYKIHKEGKKSYF